MIRLSFDDDMMMIGSILSDQPALRINGTGEEELKEALTMIPLCIHV